MKRILSVICITLAVASCGYDGNYRYPCQDPANWDAEECNPPICKVDGACTKDLIGFDPDELPPDAIQMEPTEETVAP